MRAAEVLFESESMRWDTPSSREKRETIAADARRCVEDAGECLGYAIQTGHTKENGSGINVTGTTYTISTSSDQAVLCVGDCNANASVGENVSPTLKVGGDPTYIVRSLATGQTCSPVSTRPTQARGSVTTKPSIRAH